MNHIFAMIFCALMIHNTLAMDINQNPDTPSSDESLKNLTQLINTDFNQHLSIKFIDPENDFQPSIELWNNLDQLSAMFQNDTPIINTLTVPISNPLPNPILPTMNNVPIKNVSRGTLFPKQCPVCAELLYERDIAPHMRTHTTITQEQDKETFTCHMCNHLFIDRYYLFDHMTRCIRYPICPHCNLHIFKTKFAQHICIKKSKRKFSDVNKADLE